MLIPKNDLDEKHIKNLRKTNFKYFYFYKDEKHILISILIYMIIF